MVIRVIRVIRDSLDKYPFLAYISWCVSGRILDKIYTYKKISGANNIDCNLGLKYVKRGHFSKEIIRDNSYYGHGSVFRSYVGGGFNSKTYIEHGLFFRDHVQRQDEFRFSKYAITFSQKRANVLKKLTNMEPIAVGPYIQYIGGIDGEVNKLKYKYGNYLLHFPYHTTKGIKLVSPMINAVGEFGEFDSKLACVYYEDLNNRDLIMSLKSQGFKIVTAGHKFNPAFLINLKVLIQGSKFTTSDFLGTQVGYCMAMKKPHYIFNERDLSKIVISKSYSSSYSHNIKSTLDEINQLTSIISEGCGLSLNCLKVANEYWGNDIQLTPEELRKKTS